MDVRGEYMSPAAGKDEPGTTKETHNPRNM